MNRSVALNTFTLLCNHHHHLQDSSIIQPETLSPLNSSTFLPPQPLVASILLLVSMDLTVPGNSEEVQKNPTVFVLSGTGFFHLV